MKRKRNENDKHDVSGNRFGATRKENDEHVSTIFFWFVQSSMKKKEEKRDKRMQTQTMMYVKNNITEASFACFNRNCLKGNWRLVLRYDHKQEMLQWHGYVRSPCLVTTRKRRADQLTVSRKIGRGRTLFIACWSWGESVIVTVPGGPWPPAPPASGPPCIGSSSSPSSPSSAWFNNSRNSCGRCSIN